MKHIHNNRKENFRIVKKIAIQKKKKEIKKYQTQIFAVNSHLIHLQIYVSNMFLCFREKKTTLL